MYLYSIGSELEEEAGECDSGVCVCVLYSERSLRLWCEGEENVVDAGFACPGSLLERGLGVGGRVGGASEHERYHRRAFRKSLFCDSENLYKFEVTQAHLVLKRDVLNLEVELGLQDFVFIHRDTWRHRSPFSRWRSPGRSSC